MNSTQQNRIFELILKFQRTHYLLTHTPWRLSRQEYKKIRMIDKVFMAISNSENNNFCVDDLKILEKTRRTIREINHGKK